MSDACLTEKAYGFAWGAALVDRLVSHKGYVVVEIHNPQRTSGVQVQVSPTGRVLTVRPWGKARVEAGS